MQTHIVTTELEGVVLIDVEYPRDERGFFVEVFHQARFQALGIGLAFVQDNHSRSRRGVLRGLHFQDARAPQAKLVRCARGAIYDVVVDIRVGSPTFGRWIGVELSDDNMRQILVPVGFAHGFAVLSDVADVQYKCSSYYHGPADSGIRWDDPDLGVTWPIDAPLLSQRDTTAQTLAEYRQRPAFVYQAFNPR
jgi:dTDP-4-dehydrorhamnose 3,5-epimerase